jgi:protein tyrosine phosphatase (PTP) superfamily phosphohydrolase (DUF442 family)
MPMPGLGSSAAADGLEGIINYREYSNWLSSSGQPTAPQLQAIGQAGFERVVFLAFTDHEESVAHEDRIVSRMGIDYIQIPIDWEAPTLADFQAFAGVMQPSPRKKTLVHCQVNFRASAFSFLYRALFEGIDMAEAKDDLDSVWVPNETWRRFIFDVLQAHGRSPHCDSCLWDGD